VQYHLYYRELGSWAGANLNLFTLRVLTLWIDSTQALLLAVLGGIGVAWMAQLSALGSRLTSELRLCASIIAVLGVFLAIPRPTFPQYFVFLVPFVAAFAAVGVYAIGSRLWPAARSRWLTLALVGLYMAGLAKEGYQLNWLERWRSGWHDFDRIGAVVRSVTPPNAEVYASSDSVYVSSHVTPPAGLENSFGTEIVVSPALAALLHIRPISAVDDDIAAGRFSTVVLDGPDARVPAAQRSYPHAVTLTERAGRYVVFSH